MSFLGKVFKRTNRSPQRAAPVPGLVINEGSPHPETDLNLLLGEVGADAAEKVRNSIAEVNMARGLNVKGTLHVARDGSVLTLTIPARTTEEALSFAADLRAALKSKGLPIR